jgi:hypothetical protein
MYGRLADVIRPRANMSTNQSIIRVAITQKAEFLFLCLIL